MKQQLCTTPRVLSLCIDDFGLSAGVAAAVARLSQARRITAVSCLTNMPGWMRDAPVLLALAPSVATGLHLNLTEGRPMSAQLARRWPQLPSLPRLLLQTHLGLVPRRALAAEVAAQWHAFVAATGRAPDFIDGHQHVHHLPLVRDALFETLSNLQARPAVRSTARVLGPHHAIKRWLIESTGGRALGRELDLRQFAHNPVLLGAYDFRATDYRALMRSWLSSLPAQGGLLFCHAGVPQGLQASDAIAAARGRELDYLASDMFLQDLADAHVVLGSTWGRVVPALPARPVSEMSTTG